MGSWDIGVSKDPTCLIPGSRISKMNTMGLPSATKGKQASQFSHILPKALQVPGAQHHNSNGHHTAGAWATLDITDNNIIF